MKILLSAYACEPNKGSEPGVGWNWATKLASTGYEVHVLTRANNKKAIAVALSQFPLNNLHFIYYDLPGWLKWWKKGGRGVHLYYFLWQVGIYFVAKSLINKVSFDIIHHVTFVTARQPSFLGLLGIPFIFGPVGGGESAPVRLRKNFPLRGQLTDAFRDIVNYWVRFSPLMRLTFHTAKTIYVTSEQTRNLIPKRFQEKIVIKLAIGSDATEPQTTRRLKKNMKGLRVLYAGQLLYWKGIHLALRAFSLHLEQHPDSHFTVLGKGPDRDWLKDLSDRLAIGNAVEWCEWVPRNEIDTVYQDHQVFLFPSLHDSGGMVVLEAMKNGLPVICLDLGGPGTSVCEKSGIKIDTRGCGMNNVVNELRDTLNRLSVDYEYRSTLAQGAVVRSKEMSWGALVAAIYPILDSNENNLSLQHDRFKKNCDR